MMRMWEARNILEPWFTGYSKSYLSIHYDKNVGGQEYSGALVHRLQQELPEYP